MSISLVGMLGLVLLAAAFTMVAVLSWHEHRVEQDDWMRYYANTPEPPSNVELKANGRPFDYEVD